ncbi:hypothetical protein PACTADRAFT_51070 [Pachysolen tannophilus NRRL Y-2460]|uniref:Protein DML1 n=1 Tax=Pachysolen tannophilus NRRL Y-2460 TaxID=669874 RepID=A0A1E4TR13_PACTA|nr:hypothetical protein PACTADRAFT_51070 [Pachysolen tannophilus NRRL Y-2460]
MHEIINISLSQSANHLNTHFFNAQESYLDYVKGVSNSKVEPDIFLKPTTNLLSNTVSYNPRALLWDATGGFGALGKYEYFENADQQDIPKNVVKSQILPKIAKNEYQKALDSTEDSSQEADLNTCNTLYWSDYSRVIYEPKSYNCLQDWIYDPKKSTTKAILKSTYNNNDPQYVKFFENYEVGVEEFAKDNQGVDFLEDNFRNCLEKCDGLSGLNLIDEIDSSWGGFASEILLEIKDEFLPKTSIFTWNIYENRGNSELGTLALLSRIRSTISILKNSSIFIPINLRPNNLPQFLKDKVDLNSLWHTSSLQSIIFESFNLLQCRRTNRVFMTDIENGLTMGTNRNLVSDINLMISGINSDTSGMIDLTSSMFEEFDAKKNRVFSRSCISRSPHQLKDISFDHEKNLGKMENNKLLEYGTSSKGLVNYKTDIAFNTPSSFPQSIISKKDALCCSLTTSTKVRFTFKNMKKFVSKTLKNDDRESLIDELETYCQEYEWGYTEDDESDDDDY